MERITTIEEASKIMANNFIGPSEILNCSKTRELFHIDINNIPDIPFTTEELINVKNTHILLLIIDEFKDKNKITFTGFRKYFGIDPDKYQPCFYNQDWYLNENFYLTSELKKSWMLFSININTNTRSKDPNLILTKNYITNFPTALELTYCFFVLYLIRNRILWKSDYVWCNDFDSNQDRIYVGRYIDPLKKNKNGLSIHRHLTLKDNYGAINFFFN
jgi:hypothetical protein